MRSNIFEREIKTAGHIRYLTMTDAKLIWMPDTFFRNEKIGKVVTFHRFSLFLHSGKPLHKKSTVQTVFVQIAFQPPHPQANGRFVGAIFAENLSIF